MSSGIYWESPSGISPRDPARTNSVVPSGNAKEIHLGSKKDEVPGQVETGEVTASWNGWNNSGLTCCFLFMIINS